MKLHYQGKYNMLPETLPHGEHMPGAIKFREAESSRELARIANRLCLALMVLFAIPAAIRCGAFLRGSGWQLPAGCLAALLTIFPHELLHALCFREDVYLYANLSQGMMFVVGPETMSRRRFILMSLFPNVVFGWLPYLIGLLFPHLTFFAVMGLLCLGMGAGDYYNVFNAMTQMPRGARTYLYQFHSYWYMP